MATVLVTGATGFIGGRLVPVLIEAGHQVRAMTRRPDDYDGPGDPVGGDVHDAGTLAPALEGVDVAVYLIHSLDDDDFENKDAAAARAFGLAAAASGVRQIVYLGGLGAEGDEDLSPHLRSRREVEHLLGEADVPVTAMRAAVVVGHGGISWELTRQLVKNLPAMVVPRWAATPTQPIGIEDIVAYLAGVVDNDAAVGRTFEVGGADRVTYLEMMQQAAEEMHGRRLPIKAVPILTPSLSSRWIAMVTNVDTTTAKNLIESMSTEVVVSDHSIDDVVSRDVLTYRQSVRRALEEAAAEADGTDSAQAEDRR